MPVVPIDFDCTPKCRSNAHYLDLIRVASQSLPIPVILNYLCRCGNCAKGHDKYGRTLIQVCSALPDKWPVIDWLLKQKKVDINTKNLESGYTALHYSVFYGRIDVAVNLMKAGASTSIFDHDHMTYIDHVIRDTHIEPSSEQLQLECYDVYTMGENTNGSLGHNQPTAKKVPEMIDLFHRESICIKQVKMDKYHTLFLADNGSVYSCGFGVGGRLGHDNEEPVLVPKQIMALEPMKETEQDRCIDIAVTRDCSYFLTEKGSLWSCGLNNYQQLGHPGMTKVLVPTKVQFRQLKERKITQMACGRFHVALLVEDGQLFTFGLNAGHLGHPKGNEAYIQQPLLVTKFNSQQEYVQKLACSDLTTICYTNKGDIYLLSDYKYRKIIKHVLNVSQLVVVGGKLESNGILDEENIEDELKVFYVQSKKLYLYHERENTNNRTKLCLWTTKQRLTIEDVAVGSNAIVFSTNMGQVYTASLDRLAQPNKKPEPESNAPISGLYDERAHQYLTPSPIPLLHRCRTVTTDRVGRSIAALQYYPTTHLNAYPAQPSSSFQSDLFQLFNEAEYNHDITLQLENYQTFPAHKYIICMRSPYFRERIAKKSIDQLLIKSDGNRPIDPEFFRMILEYIYTDKCPWLNFVQQIKTRDENEYQAYLIQLKRSEEDDIDDHRFFARVRQQASSASHKSSNHHGGKSKKKKKPGPTSPINDHLPGQESSEDELNQGLDSLLDLSKLLQLQNLRKRLEMIKQNRQKNGPGADTSIGQIKQRYYYTREALPDLHDVTIIAEDGKKILAHKCILTCRLEYFRSMFMADWMESQSNAELKMPVPANYLEIIIDYLYTDTIPNKFSMEQLCQILVLSDQLLIERLKQICEFHIANLVTFRDATELLHFASTFNADQLKAFVSQFICRNMATFLEGRLLDNLDQQLLSDLTKSYRNLLDCMNYRVITPYSDCPSLDEFFGDLNELENLTLDLDEAAALSARKQQTQQKRKVQTKSRTSESEQSIKVSPTKPANAAPIAETTTPVQPKKWQQEEKWTSVSSKKGSKHNKAATANTAQVSPPKPTIPGAVYSQEEADRIEAARRATVQDANNHRGPTTTLKAFLPQPSVKPASVPPKEELAPKNPWKIATPVATPSPVVPKTTPPIDKEVVTAKPSSAAIKSAPQPTRSIPIAQPSSSGGEPSKPWSILATSPTAIAAASGYSAAHMASSPPPISFKHIQDQEARAHEALRQISNKSLETIQTEELAIQALHRLYNSASEFDMYITVERVTPEIANPIWPRTSTASSTTISSPSLVLVSQKKGQK